METEEIIVRQKRWSSLSVNQDMIQKMAAFLSLFLLVVFFSIVSPHFLQLRNLMNIAVQTTVVGIMAIGVTFVIITAGIDLSVGAVMALSGVAAGFAVTAGVPLGIGLLLGVAVGTLLGAIIGFSVSKGNIPPFVATLGIMMMARGLCIAFTGGRAVFFGENPLFRAIAQDRLFDVVPTPVIYFVIIATIASFVLRRTAIGRYVYAVGSNEEAARLSGINVSRVKLFVYSLSGFLAGVCGIIMASRLNSAQPGIGIGMELNVIAASVIGGTSLMGGVGTVSGAVLGAFIMSVLRNGLSLIGVSSAWQMVVMGGVLICAVYIDVIRKKKGQQNS